MGCSWEMVAGLIKSDMPIMTEAKKLNINAAPVLQLALVLLAHGWNIFCKAIGNNGVFRFNIDMVKQLFLHETTIALRMVGSKSLIFIQIYRPNPAEVNEPRPFTENKLTVSVSWQHFARIIGQLSSLRFQFPRTKLCAICQ